MSFLDNEGDQGSPTSKIVEKMAGVLAIIAGFFVVGFVTNFAFSLASLSREWTPERISAEVESIPDLREMFVAVKANYPDEYRRFLERIAVTMKSGDNAAAQRQAFEFTRGLMRDHFDGLARAPSADLHEIARQYALLVNSLSTTDERLCSKFVMDGFAPGDRPVLEARTILSRIGALQIAAARRGEMQSRDPRGTMSEAEAQQFYRAIAARSPATARLLADQQALNAATPRAKCDAGVAIYQTAANLEPDAAANVTIDLLRQSFGSGANP